MVDPEISPLPAELRRARIQGMLDDRGYVRVSELSEVFGISGVTARADLEVLVDGKIARRVHGGAVSAGNRIEPSFEQALETSAAAKRAIGETAAAMVRNGQSILLDVGTTALAFARALARRDDLIDVVVITNGLNIALELESAIPRLTVIVTGGALRPMQHSLVNPLAHVVLGQIHADIAFIGCNGVDVAGGVTNVNLPEAEIKSLMVRSADRVVVLADASKLAQTHLGRICGIREIDSLVTDAEPDDDAALALSEVGVDVVPAR